MFPALDSADTPFWAYFPSAHPFDKTTSCLHKDNQYSQTLPFGHIFHRANPFDKTTSCQHYGNKYSTPFELDFIWPFNYYLVFSQRTVREKVNFLPSDYESFH